MPFWILGHISRGTNGFHSIYEANLDIIIEIISEWPNFAVYAEKLRRLRSEVIERGYQTYDLKLNQFNTLNHDDLWSTNLLIKPNNGSQVAPFDDVVIIDLQFAYWSSPATDLHYFFNTSLCESLRPKRFDELLKFYYEQLAHFLRQLKYQKHIPTCTEFETHYAERMFLGTF